MSGETERAHEIARRVFATCRRMGLGTVAVYSDADAHSPHVAEADAAGAVLDAAESPSSDEQPTRAIEAPAARATTPTSGRRQTEVVVMKGPFLG